MLRSLRRLYCALLVAAWGASASYACSWVFVLLSRAVGNDLATVGAVLGAVFGAIVGACWGVGRPEPRRAVPIVTAWVLAVHLALGLGLRLVFGEVRKHGLGSELAMALNWTLRWWLPCVVLLLAGAYPFALWLDRRCAEVEAERAGALAARRPTREADGTWRL